MMKNFDILYIYFMLGKWGVTRVSGVLGQKLEYDSSVNLCPYNTC